MRIRAIGNIKNGGVVYAKGDELNIDDTTAEYLIGQGVAEGVEVAPEEPVEQSSPDPEPEKKPAKKK